ncbi:hypothetical protein L1887_38452 [Cichorium endivia]|nr:hypothetical protein L1887_38452 [Cichorium endivia]
MVPQPTKNLRLFFIRYLSGTINFSTSTSSLSFINSWSFILQFNHAIALKIVNRVLLIRTGLEMAPN